MKSHWSASLRFLGQQLAGSDSDSTGQSGPEAPPEFLFERRPPRSGAHPITEGSAGHEQGGRTFLVRTKRAPHALARSENLSFSAVEVPALTITTNPSNSISIVGAQRDDWLLEFRAEADGKSEVEASERLRHISMSRSGGLISIRSSESDQSYKLRGFLVVQAPKAAPVVVHGSYSAAEILDMASAVHVAAPHARATILDTTSQVDATATVIDFAGSRGRVTLSAEAEINIKLRAPLFEGSLTAWSQGTVRVLLPPGFATHFRAIVSRSDNFVCRADIRSDIKSETKYGLCEFTYAAGTGANTRPVIELRSDQGVVLLDTR